MPVAVMARRSRRWLWSMDDLRSGRNTSESRFAFKAASNRFSCLPGSGMLVEYFRYSVNHVSNFLINGWATQLDRGNTYIFVGLPYTSVFLGKVQKNADFRKYLLFNALNTKNALGPYNA